MNNEGKIVFKIEVINDKQVPKGQLVYNIEEYLKSHGIKANIKKQTVLKLDIDGKVGLQTFLNRLWIIKYLGLRVEDVKAYDTTNGYHIYLYCDNLLDELTKVLFQVLLGDDYRRGVYNYLQITHGSIDWNILFKEKYTINKLGERVKVSEEKYNAELSQKLKDLLWLGE